MEKGECCGESDTNLECMVPSEEDNLDVSMVVADLIELSEMQQTCLVSNSSEEQISSIGDLNMPKSDEVGFIESHKKQTQPKSQQEICANKYQSSEELISPDSKDPNRSEKTVSNVSLKQVKSLEKRDSDGKVVSRQQQIQTQVSLEVKYHSAATSPMTPPEDSTAFFFPYCLNKLGQSDGIESGQVETKDAELQVETHSVATAPMTPIATRAPDLRVETHSIATAPMTPIATRAPDLRVETRSIATAPMTPIATRAADLRVETRSISTAPMTPIATRAPELRVETRSIATAPMTPIATRAPELRVETRSIATAPMTPIATRAPELCAETLSTAKGPVIPFNLSSPELIPEPEPRVKSGSDEPEPVQEVCWDEKGMTWDIYGAVVEVSVLGSAIQKHLEKQVLKKQIKLPDDTSNQILLANTPDIYTPLPSSPPAFSSSSRCSSAKGSRKKDERKGARSRQRQNPLHSFCRNLRRPNCCSRPHSE
ncbi:hypothetical protein HF521_001750 [Silurus meridionalis]|uniref:G protein-regulated inducer of neurite outgrowth C-terminal domain-containing protein n=1 Tax=Silurus meridionalis TaxID=175797 RepID=A0A8T0B8D2_SILME|nr:hypothetical protein HF521_001750 [Silurus meridionalis]